MVARELGNKKFAANAKPEVIQEERDKQIDYQTEYNATVAHIEDVKRLVE